MHRLGLVLKYIHHRSTHSLFWFNDWEINIEWKNIKYLLVVSQREISIGSPYKRDLGPIKTYFIAFLFNLCSCFLLLDHITPKNPWQVHRAPRWKNVFARHAHTHRILGYQVYLITDLHIYLMPDLFCDALVPNYVTQDFNFILPQLEAVLL